MRSQPRNDRARRDRDAGTILPLVLVMIVIGSLWVVPVLSYSSSTFRANRALSEQTQRIEAVKSGLRVSLADPVSVYERCGNGGPSTPVGLASTTATGISVLTNCYYIDHQSAQSAEELRVGLVATQVGKSPPPELTGNAFVPADPMSTSEWYTDATLQSETDKIWLPDLPVHALNLRSPGGYQMPTGYPSCTVYFPGTYLDPLVLDGPTFFTSGIYYFENEVRVEGGGDIVVGAGSEQGCATDQEAAFYAENAPSTHNIGGLGATWVFGDEGRLVVTNDNGSPIDLVFNRRYVSPEDTGAAASADVSLISVNGELDIDGLTGIDLYATGLIEVPLSAVGGDTPIPATQQDYLPSVFTPKPTVPDQVESVTAQAFRGAVSVSWPAPLDGGATITGYTVSASSGGGCTTNGSTTCVVTGLSTSSPVSFTVVATNLIGDSDPSDPSGVVTPSTSLPLLNPPAQPAPPTAVPYSDSARVSWTAPADGGAPITTYTVTATPGGESCVVEMDVATPPPLECDVENLDPLELTGYTFTVVATNAIASSPASSPSSPPTIVALALGDPPPPPVVTPPEYVPTAIVDILLPEAAAVNVNIPGYVALPQGRLHVDNPHGHDVRMAGGVLTAQFDIADARASGPQTVDIGFIEAVVQRKFRIVSSNSQGDETSVAIVQINQNGAYAVNSWEVQ